MVLVAYSDSEGSDNEQSQPKAPQPKTASPATAPKDGPFNSIVDRSNPRKIRVNLADRLNGNKDLEEPAAKKPRLGERGGGAFGGFNAMLPAPKRTAQTSTNASKGGVSGGSGVPRRVFSLKTGAEPGFDRAADAELRQLFAEQDDGESLPEGVGQGRTVINGGPTSSSNGMALPVPSQTNEKTKPSGHAFMFKPLSVARTAQKKKKPTTSNANSAITTHSDANDANDATVTIATSRTGSTQTQPAAAVSKVSLFSIQSEAPDTTPPISSSGVYEPLVYSATTANGNDPDNTDVDHGFSTTGDHPATMPAPSSPSSSVHAASNQHSQTEPQQTLESISRDLNLSKSAQRQLFGNRHHQQQQQHHKNNKHNQAGSTTTVVPTIHNFNTDLEYASNETLRQSGEAEANQHHSVRSIQGSGRNSLKSLISSASGQMEALEESFAAGRRNRREAGGKYGW